MIHKVTLYLEDDIDETLQATASATLGTILEIGDGTWGMVGEVIGVRLETLPSIFTED